MVCRDGTMHVVVRGRRRLQGEKYLCGRACHVSKYSIGLAREGIDLAIDRSIRRSRIRCCRRPGLDLLVVQHRVDHTRCVASLTFSPSLLRCLCSWLAPFSSFSPFSSSPFSSSPPIHRSTLTSILLSRLSYRCSLSCLSLATTIHRESFFFWFNDRARARLARKVEGEKSAG